MPNIMEQCLLQKLVATFEELALVCADTQLSDDQRDAPVDVAMSVSFTGPLTGCLVLRATSHILPGIAENMLGTSESSSRAVHADALGELANVLCGNVLPLVGGAHSVFVLSAPVVPAENAMHREIALSAEASIGIENGRAVALLQLSDSSQHALGLHAAAA